MLKQQKERPKIHILMTFKCDQLLFFSIVIDRLYAWNVFGAIFGSFSQYALLIAKVFYVQVGLS